MSKLTKYKSGIITIEIQSHIPEKFINMLWKNGVQIKNIRKQNITTMLMDIRLSDYSSVEDAALKTKTKIKVVSRKGLIFFLIKMRRRAALVGGVAIFGFMLYYLSGYIWRIDIETENNLSPYEIRQQLASIGIMPGIRKSKIDVYRLQENMIKRNDNIMYFKARIEGARLSVSAVETYTPPKTVQKNNPLDIVAKKDGQVVRIFTSSGTAAVKPGDTVKAGDLLIKGEQGKVDSTYAIQAKGGVIAKTFYEEEKVVPVKGVKKERTGSKIENVYIKIFGKKLYLKNSLNNFKSYDKIEENDRFIRKEIYYEVREAKYELDPEKVVKNTSEQLYEKILQSLDKSIVIKDKKVDFEPQGDNYKVRVLVIAEEDIAAAEKLQ